MFWLLWSREIRISLVVGFKIVSPIQPKTKDALSRRGKRNSQELLDDDDDF